MQPGYKSLVVKADTYNRVLATKTHPRDTIDMLVTRLLDNQKPIKKDQTE